jgi:hypothetical protein
MTTSKRCYICKKAPPTTLVLMNGVQGYRRYPLCEKCAKEALDRMEAKQREKTGGGLAL